MKKTTFGYRRFVTFSIVSLFLIGANGIAKTQTGHKIRITTAGDSIQGNGAPEVKIIDVSAIKSKKNPGAFSFVAPSPEDALLSITTNKKKMRVEQSARGARAAAGVLIEFQTPSLLKFRKDSAARGLKGTSLTAALSGHQGTLSQERKVMLGRIQDALRLKLIPKRMRPAAGAIRFHSFKKAFNGIALFNIDFREAKRKLERLPGVKKVHINQAVHADLFQSVSLTQANQLWSYISPNGVPLDGTGMRIGVIDTGVDYTHPNLGGCFGVGCKVVGGYDFVNMDSDPMDDQGHGTHVSSTIVGTGLVHKTDGSYAPISGVAPGASLYVYKTLNAGGVGYTDAIISAIERCTDPNGDSDFGDRLDVCSMSLGGIGNPDDPLSLAVDSAVDAGVVFAIAGGNSGPTPGTIGSPGTARSAITVAASCKPDDIGVNGYCAGPIASYSSVGPVSWVDSNGQAQTLAKPDITAPGTNICAAQWGTWQQEVACGDRYIAISGTSMATPHIAGVAALIRSAHPELSPAQVKAYLMTNAKSYGLSPSVQGTGLVQAFDTLTYSGIPSTLAKIDGLPLAFQDPFTSSASQDFSKTITITNISGINLVFTPGFSSSVPEFTATFDKSSIPLSAGESTTLVVTLTLQHANLTSPTTVNGLFTLTAPQGTVQAGASVAVPSRGTVGSNVIDFGFDSPANGNWNPSVQVAVTNRLQDQSLHYSVAVTCCGIYSAGTQYGITATPGMTDLNIGPQQTVNLPISLSVINSALQNGRYSGYLLLTSEHETLNIPITFFKGYSMTLSMGSPQPIGVVIHATGDYAFTFHPTPGVETAEVFLTTQGPWGATAYWTNVDSNTMGAVVVQDNIQANSIPPLVDVSQALATNTLTYAPVAPDGSPATNGNWDFTLNHRATGARFVISGGISSTNQIRTNSFSSAFKLTSTMWNIWNGQPIFYEFVNESGVNSSATITNPSNGFQSRQMAAVTGDSGAASANLIGLGCTFFYDFQSYFGLSFCSYGFSTLSIPSGQGFKFYSFNNSPTSPANASYPDYPLFGFQQTTSTGVDTLTSDGFSVDASGMTSMRIPFTDDQYPFTPSQYVYSRFANTPPPSPLYVMGAAPLFDTSRWWNYADADTSLGIPTRFGRHPHSWGFSGFDRDAGTATYSISLGGSVIDSGTFDYGNVYLPVGSNGIASGKYTFNLTRPITISGVNTTVSTTSTFHIYKLATYNSRDENPPSLKEVRLLGNGILQSVFDRRVVNTLSFTVEPNGALVLRNPAGEYKGTPYDVLPDSLSLVQAFYSIDGGSVWKKLSLADLGAGSYSAAVPKKTASLYHFKIIAKDTAKNSLTHIFAIPSGTALPTYGL